MIFDQLATKQNLAKSSKTEETCKKMSQYLNKTTLFFKNNSSSISINQNIKQKH